MSYVCPHCGASARGTMAETWAWDKNHRTECTERPTPVSDLEARIAEVLADHHIVYWGRCKCGTVVAIDSSRETGDQLREHLASVTAAMLAPVVREAQAEAWDKGAGEALHHVGLTYNRQSTLRNHNPYRSNDE